MQLLIEDKYFLSVFSIIAGLIFGSFATALIYRLPRGGNWVSQRSECTICKHKLGFFDLFPIFSYLFSLGKCRYCKTKFGVQYLAIELLMAFIFFLGILFLGFTLKGIIFCLLSFSIVVMAAIDFEHYIIPDEINFFIGLLGAIYSGYYAENIADIITMPLFCFCFAMALRYGMFIWKKKEGLGFGDVKFFLVAGFFLKFENFPAFLMFSGLIGIFIAILWKILKKGELFPFGPALGVSLLFCYAFSEIGYMLIGIINKII